MTAPWKIPEDAPVIEQSIHDYVVSIFRIPPYASRKLQIVPISPGAEAKRGWDAAIVEAIPLYFQYKLPEFTSRPKSSQSQIWSHRSLWKFDDTGGLFYFNLRAKAKGEPRSQHELLVAMEAKGERVYYVAPTFIDQERLQYGGALMPGGVPWILGHVTISHFELLERINVPQMMGLICIPPYMDVNAPPEDHRFCFNCYGEVSLHSDPVLVEAKSIYEVVNEQIRLADSRQGITEETVDSYVSKILMLVAGGDQEQQVFGKVRAYYEESINKLITPGGRSLMPKLRALAKVVNRLTDLELMLTLRKQ
ncbi:MAG: hypothetical protein HZB95_03695 [Nitrosomonadales bacterium]|nr:hypothetical protein [Nitrosomonadales bacterium]